MKTLHLSGQFRRILLVAGCAVAVVYMAAAQESPQKSEDWNDYLKPGSAKGWYDFRNEVKLPASEVFTTYKWLFHLGDADEMRLHSQKADRLGFTHFKYYQYYRNYRIWGSDVIVHERNGRTESVNGNMVAGMNQQTTPMLTEDQARAIAIQSMGSVKFLWEEEEAQRLLREEKNDPSATWYPAGELVWSRANGEAAFTAENFSLYWTFDVRIQAQYGESKRVFVNATNGELILSYSTSYQCDAGTGNTAWYGNRDISTDNETFGSDFLLRDDCTGSHDYKIYTKNKNNGGSTTEYKDADNSWTSSGDIDGVTTHWCLHRTLDYYNEVHGRNSWNDNGGNVTAYNNGFGSFTSNSCWGCSGNAIDLGEGPTTASTDDWNSMDVVGHEFTHGVTQDEAGLEYHKQSGALNESFSDIYGTVIENWTGAGLFDWNIGEEFTSPIRDMSNPNANGDPDTYQGAFWFTTDGCNPSDANDNCGVHTNSGVQNYFFYLLSMGGSGTNDNGDSYDVTGIGITDAADIGYRALTVYLTSTSGYAEARESWIRASNDIFGSCSDESIAVGKAWYAVGVGTQQSYYDVNVCGDLFPILGDAKYNGVNSVTAAIGCTTTVLPFAPFSVTFEAANAIVLDDGFVAEEGSTFYAVLDDCNISYWERNETGPHPDQYDSPASSLEKPASKLEVFPSPFESGFEISVIVPQNTETELSLCDLTGRVLKQILVRQALPDGFIKLHVNGEELAAGTYFIHGLAGNKSINEKVIKVN